MPDLLVERLAPAQARARLVSLARHALEGGVRRVVRVEVPLEPLDALAWLAEQPQPERFFWSGRGEGAVLAGAGAADIVEADTLKALAEHLEPRLRELPPQARYVGAARFAPGGRVDSEWAPFGRVRFVLPRVELRIEGEQAVLATHVLPEQDAPRAEAVLAELAATVLPGPARTAALPTPIARGDSPDADGWRANVRWALEQFDTGALEKVVLARRVRYGLDGPLDPFALLQQLRTATPGCYHTLVGVGDAAFVSATPERLLRVKRRHVESEAVAGTRPRAEGQADRRLRDDLLASEKDRREHAVVREALTAQLSPLTEALYVDDQTTALTLARGRHLYAAFRGTLCDGVSGLHVLRALHPTPAVGGTPRAEALDAIAQREPFDRGLYAGPVGWIGAEAAEFAVGIRSGLVRGETLDLYSGAGLVRGSDPDAEWAEIEHKIGDFARVLGLGDGH